MPRTPTKLSSTTTLTQPSGRVRSRRTVLTSKTQPQQLKRALTRGKNRANLTHLIDHAVPASCRFQGVVNTYTQQQKPTVEYGEHLYSPFVLSLKPQPTSAQDVLDSYIYTHLAVNLLNTHAPQSTPTRVAPDVSQDLQLDPEVVETQLVPSFQINPFRKTFSLGTTTPVEGLFSQPVHPFALHTTPVQTSISGLDAFSPRHVPEDIFAYFDFPEEESPEEADVVTLEELDETYVAPPTQKKPRWSLPQPILPFSPLGVGWRRAIASFVGLSFIFVLPLQAMNAVHDLQETRSHLERTGEEAVKLLSSGASSALARNVNAAGTDFRQANDRFLQAKQTIDNLGAGTNTLLSLLPVTQDSYRSGQALIEAGHALSIAASRITAGYSAMEAEISPTPISRLNILEAYLTSTVPYLEQAQSALNEVDVTKVPTTHQETLTTLKQALPAVLSTLEEFQTFYALAKQLLGADGAKHYLIIFQNNTEIRPTGGFIGSFAEITIRDGVIEHLNVPGGGSYDLQGSLQQNLIAPQPLQLLSARWEFQDANWFADFPTSARQLLQIYRDAGGPTVDGLLAINATFVADLIGVLGPIEMESAGKTIHEENFIFEAQKAVELEYDREENKPKAFIGDLAPLLVERAIEKTSEDFLAVVDLLNTGLSQKDIQLYLTDDTLQRDIIKQGWSGEVKWTDGDYLMVVDTNLGGGKTDGVIEQHVDLQVNVATDGTITNTVTISRTHHGIQGLLFTGVNNVDFMRVYVPQGSTLIEASGFNAPDSSLFEFPDEDWIIDDDLAYTLLTQEVDPVSRTVITQEHGKTVFGNWVQTKPGTTSTVTLRYTLPNTIAITTQKQGVLATAKSLLGLPRTQEYQLLIQKQSGILNRTTRVRVNLPDSVIPLWSSHDLTQAQITNTTDTLFAILLESL